jgi:hypothetical protein
VIKTLPEQWKMKEEIPSNHLILGEVEGGFMIDINVRILFLLKR